MTPLQARRPIGRATVLAVPDNGKSHYRRGDGSGTLCGKEAGDVAESPPTCTVCRAKAKARSS